jgi:two-component system sensor histidine kinase KdpD
MRHAGVGVLTALAGGALAVRLHWPVARVAWAVAALAIVAAMTDKMVAYWVCELREAESANLRMRRLYELTRRTLEMDLLVEPGPRLALVLHEIFELEGVAVFDADLHEVYEAGHWSTSPRELAQNVYHFETSDDDPATGISRRVVRLGTVPVGSLVLRGDTSPLTNSAIAALTAVTFDRYRATANESRIEAERQAEQMRSTVLDNLAHAYKTPLTAIRAASSGLSEMGELTAAQAGLVALIDEQARLLSELTGKLLITARMEAGVTEDGSGAFALHTALESAASLIEDVVEGLADRSSGIRIEVEVPDQDLVFACDRRLLEMLLTQYLDNACKYADFDSTVTVRAERTGKEVLFSVHSVGPVIPIADRERIFDRYYRSSNASRNASGTGIGLSIAKRVALVHGGAVWVSSDEEQGTTFFAAIPESKEEGSDSAPGARTQRRAQNATGARAGADVDLHRATELERSAL